MTARRLPDNMQEILDHMATGIRLVGPVRVSSATREGTRYRLQPWGFADGRRAGVPAVLALLARGLIRIVARRDGYEARLAGAMAARRAVPVKRGRI